MFRSIGVRLLQFPKHLGFPVIAHAGLKKWADRRSEMLILKLNKVERPGYGSGSSYRDHDDEGDLQQPRENTRVVYVPWDKVRGFQPRRDNNKVGSRLTFVDGGGYAVTETPDQIIGLLGPDAEVRAVSAEVLQLSQPRTN